MDKMNQTGFKNPRSRAASRIAPILFTMIVIALFLSCSEERTITPSPQTTYYTDVRYVFDIKCATTNCHAGSEPAAGLGMETYDEILAGSDHGSVIVPGDAEASLLFRTMAGTSPPLMPTEGKLPQDHIDVVKKWIDDGAFKSR